VELAPVHPGKGYPEPGCRSAHWRPRDYRNEGAAKSSPTCSPRTAPSTASHLLSGMPHSGLDHVSTWGDLR